MEESHHSLPVLSFFYLLFQNQEGKDGRKPPLSSRPFILLSIISIYLGRK
jgi:hypothetical protein